MNSGGISACGLGLKIFLNHIAFVEGNAQRVGADCAACARLPARDCANATLQGSVWIVDYASTLPAALRLNCHRLSFNAEASSRSDGALFAGGVVARCTSRRALLVCAICTGLSRLTARGVRLPLARLIR